MLALAVFSRNTSSVSGSVARIARGEIDAGALVDEIPELVALDIVEIGQELRLLRQDRAVSE